MDEDPEGPRRARPPHPVSPASQFQDAHPEPSLSLLAKATIQPAFSQWLVLFILYLSSKTRPLPWTPSLVLPIELEPLSSLSCPYPIYSICRFYCFTSLYPGEIGFTWVPEWYLICLYIVQFSKLLFIQCHWIRLWMIGKKQFPQPPKQAELVPKPETPDSCSQSLSTEFYSACNCSVSCSIVSYALVLGFNRLFLIRFCFSVPHLVCFVSHLIIIPLCHSR